MGMNAHVCPSMSWTPGDFIKPDPALSVEATRDHILNELHRYFTNTKNTSDRLVRVQKIVEGVSLETNTLGDIIFDTLHAYLTDTSSFLMDLLPENVHDAFVEEVIGFVEEDTLPNGSTILSLWLETEPEPETEPEAEKEQEFSFWDLTVPIPLYVMSVSLVLLIAFAFSTTARCSLGPGNLVRSEL